MKRQFIVLISATLFWLSEANLASGQNNEENAINERIIGTWTNSAGTRSVEFIKQENRYFGKIVRTSEGDRLKSGEIVFYDLLWDQAHYRGKMKTPRGLFSCTITFFKNDIIEIKAQTGMVSRSVRWSRAK
jgi:uncharacterized protein (DUF2147 family)